MQNSCQFLCSASFFNVAHQKSQIYKQCDQHVLLMTFYITAAQSASTFRAECISYWLGKCVVWPLFRLRWSLHAQQVHSDTQSEAIKQTALRGLFARDQEWPPFTTVFYKICPCYIVCYWEKERNNTAKCQSCQETQSQFILTEIMETSRRSMKMGDPVLRMSAERDC